MIHAILKIQGCTTKAGRRAFVSRSYDKHGIAAGPVRFYHVTAPTWAQLRSAVASYDTSGRKTMGFTGINAETVEKHWETPGTGTGSVIKPLPAGTTAAQIAHINEARHLVSQETDTDLSWLPNGGSGIDKRVEQGK